MPTASARKLRLWCKNPLSSFIHSHFTLHFFCLQINTFRIYLRDLYINHTQMWLCSGLLSSFLTLITLLQREYVNCLHQMLPSVHQHVLSFQSLLLFSVPAIKSFKINTYLYYLGCRRCDGLVGYCGRYINCSDSNCWTEISLPALCLFTTSKKTSKRHSRSWGPAVCSGWNCTLDENNATCQ
jgi:hypothetical protein